MRGGVILIALALIIGYLGVTGRYKCFSCFVGCLYEPGSCACGLEAVGATEPSVKIEPGSSGVNPSGGQIYDATTPTRLFPIEAFV